ncbi:MAG: hypothetical protein LBT52_03895 [Clostridiales Family XIII bacterium]|jgi:nitrogen regulatory protein PII|nr:hypothetical protein [Clostridiales Family XIII bacterium]
MIQVCGTSFIIICTIAGALLSAGSGRIFGHDLKTAIRVRTGETDCCTLN